MAEGMRQRKRRAAMRHIQEVALDLFDERSFEDVSIEEVARMADVSPSSIYRYFGTKEQLVLYDEVDVQLIERMKHGLDDLTPVEAVRQVLTAVLAEYFSRDDPLIRRKLRYAFEEPALRAAVLQQTDAFVPLLADALATTTGRRPTDLDVQVIAAAIMAALIAAVRHWHAAGGTRPLGEDIERALDVLEAGLRLASPTPPSPSTRGAKRSRTAPPSTAVRRSGS